MSALNAVGEGGLSNERSATPAAPATAPGAPDLTGATAGNASVSLAWSAPGSNGGSRDHRLQGLPRHQRRHRDAAHHARQRHRATPTPALTNGTTYYYKVERPQRGRRGRPVERALRHARRARHRPRRTRPDQRHRRQRPRQRSPGAHPLQRRLRDHRLQGLPRHQRRQRQPAHHARQRHRLHRQQRRQRHHLLLHGQRRQRGRRRQQVQRALRNAGRTRHRPRRTHASTAPPPATAPSASPGAHPAPTAAPRSPATRSTAAPAPATADAAGHARHRHRAAPTDSAANGTTYYYTVSALNTVGEGAKSNERSATPAAPATAPGAPTLDSATAGNGSRHARLERTRSNGGSAITGYRVYRGTSAGNGSLLTTLGTVTGYTDNSAANGTTYYYTVSAVNAVGEGASSTSAPPRRSPRHRPRRTHAHRATAGNGSVSARLERPSSNGGSAITGYKVYRGTSAGNEHAARHARQRHRLDRQQRSPTAPPTTTR